MTIMSCEGVDNLTSEKHCSVRSVKGSPFCANERLCNTRQRDSKTESWVDLPLFTPKIPKIVDEKIRHGAENPGVCQRSKGANQC
jgi:hypothetical protein